jgi:hypothetical protein
VFVADPETVSPAFDGAGRPGPSSRTRRRSAESAQALMDRLDACDDVEPRAVEEARRWWRARKTA